MQIKGSHLGFYNNVMNVLRQYCQRCILNPTKQYNTGSDNDYNLIRSKHTQITTICRF